MNDLLNIEMVNENLKKFDDPGRISQWHYHLGEVYLHAE